MAELFVEHSGIPLDQRTSRHATIWIHGLFGDHKNLRGIANTFPEQANTLVDCRNHGNSPHTHTMLYQDMANDIATLYHTLNLDACTLIGHSMGGKIAMTCALLNTLNQLSTPPITIHDMVILDIAPKAYPPHHTHILNALQALDLSQYTSRTQVTNALESAIPDLSLRQFLSKNIATHKTPDTPPHLQWRIHLPAIQDAYPTICDFPSHICTTPCHTPTLFIAGSHSPYITPEDHPFIQQTFPAATIKNINASHWVHAEQPQQVAALIQGFKNQITWYLILLFIF